MPGTRNTRSVGRFCLQHVLPCFKAGSLTPLCLLCRGLHELSSEGKVSVQGVMGRAFNLPIIPRALTFIQDTSCDSELFVI
jgi:hypothetical protein